MDLLIQNGTVVTATERFAADVAVHDGKIAALGAGLSANGATVVDAAGKLVLPGAIDAHTHLAMPYGDSTNADGYFSGTRAAACGGVTTVFDYPVQYAGQSILEVVCSKRAVCEREACVDYAFHCCITDLNGGAILDEMADAVREGVTSFKCYMVYRQQGLMVDDATLARLLVRARELGAVINVHAENADLIDLNVERFLREGKTDPWHHYLSRPEFVEAEADKRAVHWARNLRAPLYLVHMADREGLEACVQAKADGCEVYVETCPHYLAFTCDVYKREDARDFVCSPPMKGQDSQDALWRALRAGFIDTVATDHCPFQRYQKDWGRDDFTKIPNGCDGVENLYPFLLDAANAGRISFERAVAVCSANPARIFGCGDKGSLAVGKDADIVLYDPDLDFTVRARDMHSDCDHTIWEGRRYHGYPVQTYLRGRLVYDRGAFVGEPGWGRYVKRLPSTR